MGSEIKRWQQSVVRDGSTETSSSKRDGFTSRLSKAACQLFHLCLDQGDLGTIGPHRRELSRVYGYLQLWCDGYGALTGDLDVALSESKRLRRDTYRLLVSICHIMADIDLDNDWQRGLHNEAARTRDLIEEATFANGGDDGSDSGSDSGSDTSSVTSDFNIEEITKDLKTDILCLVELGPRYKEPIRDRTVEEQPVLPSLAMNWDPAEHLASRIRHRYPDGDALLAHVFGKMNWERAKRLYAAREANARAVERPSIQLAAASEAKGTHMWLRLPIAGGQLEVILEIACPLCQEHIGSEGIAHLARHLEEISLTILPTNTESDDESDGNPGEGPEGSKDGPNIPDGTFAKSPEDPTSSEGSRTPATSKPGGQHNGPAWSRAIALYDLKPARASELPLVKGQDLWVLKLAERAPGAAWIPALSDQGQRQGWVPRSYARLIRNNKSLAEGDGPELPHPSTEFEFHTQWGESYQAALPSAYPPLSPIQEPRENIGVSKLDGAGADETSTTGNANDSETAVLPHPLDAPEEPGGGVDERPNNSHFILFEDVKYHLVNVPPNPLGAPENPKGGVDDRPNNGDFVLFEGVRDDLVYFPPLFDDTEAPRASQELSEAIHGDGPREDSRHPVPWSLFTCPEPGCNFRSRKENLERHRRRHGYDGEGWACMERGCGTRWSTKELLNQHRSETHAKPEIDTEAEFHKPRPGVSREAGSSSSSKRGPGEDSDMQALFRSSYGRVTGKKKDIG
ncbi:hypothetical protein CHGG_09544 [Chaetomium globosum CBS 148.51]|uniref:SH3 domain-containing protein n=1 Tax=Chaetomium globosum (strain ATCC 6205 / CBS 148.51 / DSM 1962 / NBRC 6347 / NRRL 1970) TaxID=306901 RepID=Q2GR60_CHAGB|nr:uncharacterized protein CHGG_09544 [Chaetomium globosum CBS 148.51]EAQ85530.1 hypothetical protein CHGG_09544 [Chaetomium globosum CBS 148.51]